MSTHEDRLNLKEKMTALTGGNATGIDQLRALLDVPDRPGGGGHVESAPELRTKPHLF